MEQYIIEKKFATIDEICEKFEVHPNTARSYIKELSDKGIVQKRYGGVSCVTSSQPVSFLERQQRNAQSKRQIGQRAAAMLNEDDVIFADSGTTVTMLFQAENPLPKHITVITNNLNVLLWLACNTDYTVFGLPGKLNRQLNALASLETIESLKAYHINKAFFGTRGISQKGELTSTSSIDAKLKATAIEISEQVILMADSQKIDQTALFNFSSLADVDYWICDENTDKIQNLAQQFNVEVLECDK